MLINCTVEMNNSTAASPGCFYVMQVQSHAGKVVHVADGGCQGICIYASIHVVDTSQTEGQDIY